MEDVKQPDQNEVSEALVKTVATKLFVVMGSAKLEDVLMEHAKLQDMAVPIKVEEVMENNKSIFELCKNYKNCVSNFLKLLNFFPGLRT